MSSNDATASTKAPDAHEPDFVLDFLYYDVRRVHSFLAQFDKSGHLTAVKQSETASKTEGDEGGMQTTGNLAIAKVVGSFKHIRSSSGGEGAERTYDPFWANALNFLDLLEQENMIKGDLQTASIGDLVIISGTLGLLDTSLLKLIWDIPEIRTMLEAGLSTGVTTPPGMKISKNQMAKLLVKTFSYLPQTTQVRIGDDDGNLAYGPIQREGLIASTVDIFLNHGVIVPGRWSVLGMLDAKPGSWLSDDKSVADRLHLGRSGALPILMTAIEGLMREAGRPVEAYGLTPLLIFRKAG